MRIRIEKTEQILQKYCGTFYPDLCIKLVLGMSQSYTIRASLGPIVIAEDVLFTSSLASAPNSESSWTKTKAYAPISKVPLKASLSDQIRQTGTHPDSIALTEGDVLLSQFRKLEEKIEKIDISRELEIGQSLSPR